MARPCGKTDDEENLLMKAIEKDVFYVVFPALSRDLLCISLKERLFLFCQQEEIPHLRAGRQMARPCGKTDGEAVREDR